MLPRFLTLALLAGAVLQAQAPGDCVTIGAPKPALNFTYRYSDSTGGKSEYTNRWEQFTPTTSKLLTTRAGSKSEYVSRHQIVDDLLVLESSISIGTDANGPFKNEMSYKPGATGDTASRACAGRTWSIPAVTITGQGRQGSFSTRTDPGTMTIVAIKESVTVPAGTFQIVRYTKTMKSGRGPLVDELWKSIEHGVTVKHTFKHPGVSGGEELIAIK